MCVCLCVFVHVLQSFFVTLWTITHQAPLFTGFSRQEYWSGLPFFSPGNLPNPRIEPRSPELQTDSLLSEPPGKPELVEGVVFKADQLSVSHGDILKSTNACAIFQSNYIRISWEGDWLSRATKVFPGDSNI